MRTRSLILSLCLLCLAGAWLLWHQPVNTRTRPSALPTVAAPAASPTVTASKILTPVYVDSAKPGTVLASTNPFAWRLSNTTKPLDQLVNDSHAILLENALIDTGSPLNFSIPVHLRSQGDPGAYIIQARGPINAAFRAMLAAAGAEIVSYIPNDAYLVRAPAGVANGLAGNPLTQAVTPYEPYYKIQSSLLTQAVGQMDLPDDTVLTLGLFTATAPQTIKQIENLDWKVLSREETPVGTIVRVQQPLSRSTGWLVLATLPGTKNVELSRQRVPANDLSRVATGVAVNTRTTTNYLNLSGSNVLVQVNDFGIDATHPDLAGRVFGSPTTDTSGHGTHVAGIIAGNGLESTTVTNARGSIMPGTNGQFRGKAPLANLLSMNRTNSDQELQAAAARTNALISNNSWNYDGDNTYNLAAASYDAAVRDALPGMIGSQPVLFVFSAGNFGNGDDTIDPGGGKADTIQSPATAKNVITVGALQEFRNITNKVTTISANGATNIGTPWQPETSTSFRIAGFSSRGNVGIGTEGKFGRYKPDVVAPGTFVVSTRSADWDIVDYFFINPTSHTVHTFSNIVVQVDSLWANTFPIIPNNTVQAAIYVTPNPRSPVPFPFLPIYFGLVSSPAYTAFTINNQVTIPPDGGLTIASILGSQQTDGFNYGVSNTIANPISISITTDIVRTNNPGDYYLVLSNLDQAIGTFRSGSTGPGPYYRYETGTSMSAADVSGVLALMQDYFTNTLHLTPSPVLLKAMLINGARVTGSYDFQAQNSINYEGWGLVNLTNAVPPGITNQLSAACASYFADQNPTNALATGDSHTYHVTVASAAAALPLRITLAWTDPPGDPAAAIKLVNDLNLVVTNLSNPANPVVFYGNDIPASSTFNSARSPTNSPNYDSINNVENVYLPQGAGTNFYVTVLGYRVNVNAVTAQTNNAAGVYAPNVVQDYALVISCGNGQVTNAFTVTDNPIVSNPTSDQQITFVTTTNQPLLNQIVGASSPLLGTNNLPVGTNTTWGSNGVVTVGMTNQWHFYVVTNTGASDFTNAAFITFIPSTLAIPRTGVFADSTANATRPEADIDLYVAGPNDPNASGLMNLDPTVISNCLAGANGDAASLSRGGTEFVVYTNSVPGQVYYIGVYSEDREAAEYGFIPIFTDIPFSQPGPNGSQIVNGLNVPVNIPDGSPAHPGVAYVFAIALSPMEVNRVVLTNIVTHQNYGDLIGTLAHGNSSGASQSIVLNNHDSLFNPPGIYTHIYDDSGRGDIVSSQPSDGPGSLNNFVGQQGVGVWMLTEVDDSLTQTGSVAGFNLLIEPHQDLTKGITVTLEAGTWFYSFIDVPAGFTNLSIFATNLPPPATPPLQLYLNYGVQPDFTNYLEFVLLTNGVTTPGNSISYGPPLLPGRYFVGLFNPDTVSHNVYLLSTLGGFASAIQPGDYTTNNVGPLLDDAVNSSTIFISSTQQIASVNVGFVVEHPRISDLTFTLVSPTGQRILLMENRGGTTTNGAGDFFFSTNNFAPITAQGFAAPETNYLNVGRTFGDLTISYDFFGIPDQMTVYYSTNIIPANLITNTLMISGSGQFTIHFGPGFSTFVTIIMNQFGNPNGGTAWDFTAGGVQTNYNYLAFTEDTNLATIPIKFAIPPYTLTDFGTNYTLSDFELATNGNYLAPTNIFDARGGWNLTNRVMVGTNLVTLSNNMVSVVTDPANASGGSNFLALANGTISRVIPMIPGRQFNLSFMYRGPGIAGWWRGEGNATDSSNPENDGNNGELIGRFNFPAGAVGQAFEFEDAGSEFQFAGTNTYVQIRQRPFLMLANTNGGSDTNLFLVQSSLLDVGTGSGFTIEGWINPTNVSFQQPLVEWLTRVPTNGSDTNLVIEAGPFLNRATGHYYYLLGSTNWTTSELWATQLGGHLATIETANEENWVYDSFANYGGTNRNLWIGLTNNPSNPTNFGWSSGLTNVVYTNWTAVGPTNCSGSDIFTAILGQTNAFPGLWVLENNSGNDNDGVTCGVSPSNHIYGVVEVEEIQTNGVQLWISVTVTNDINSSNSCLYANLVDTTNGSHIIYSASGLVRSNVYQHVALTYSTNSGLAVLYYNGTNVATTNLGVFVPKTTGDVLLGRDMSRATNNFYGGKMDEMSIYGRCLSASEIAAIYNLSALSTNRNLGKFDPAIMPAYNLAEARVSFGGLTNIIQGANHRWQMQNFTFIATTNSLPLQISGMEPGMLLDSFSVAEAPLGNLYYLPEQSLDSLIGTSAHGTWTLQIWDNRVGAFIPGDQLVSWQLQIVLQTNTLPAVALPPQEATTITVPPGLTVYLTVDVPSWANFATNILVSATAPVDLLFNQTDPPTGSNPGDFFFVTNNTVGSYTMSTNPVPPPPLLPGQTYYLGVRNSGAHAVTAVVRVDFDITALSNGVPVTGVLKTNDLERYFVFNVSSNAYEATFQLLQLSGNADLVVRKGSPLPTLLSSDYGSFNVGNVDENIYVFTNSSPVALSPGRWYLGVFKRDVGPVTYTVLAKELDLNASTPNIIDLTNNVPFDFTAGPGAALTNFFRFTVTNSPPAIHFELYNLSGNGDLTVQTNAPPFGPPFFQSSQQPGQNAELIFMATNSALSSLTNSALTNLNARWFLGVPNHETNLITYTIVAVLDTNGYFPAFPGAAGTGGGAAGGGRVGNNGTVYHVVNLDDSGPGSLRDAVSSSNRTIVFDVSGTIALLSPLVITNSFLTIAGQTAPGGGITVAGSLTTVQSAHDVVIRYLRFRPAGVAPVVAWTNGFEGAAAGDYTSASGSFDGWIVITNQGTVISNMALAYQGANLLALADGVISKTLPTLVGQTYTLSYAYRGPSAIALWRGESIANDSIGGNNPATVQNITYTNGVVGKAMVFNGTSSYIEYPASSSLNVGTNSSGFTLDTWLYWGAQAYLADLFEWNTGSGSGDAPVGLALSIGPYNTGGTPDFAANLEDTANGFHTLFSIGNVVAIGSFQHVALTYDKISGNAVIYQNGVVVANGNLGSSFTPKTGIPLYLGWRAAGNFSSPAFNALQGYLDEPTIYNRPLSASEIKAIYNQGSAGKYNTNAPSIAQGLAEAQVTLNGTPQPIFFGNNTNWQTTNITFTATQANTPLQITGIEPGMLLDAVRLTPNVATNVNPGDSLQFTNVMDVIADHISTSWSTNHLVSVLGSSNVTVQWSIMADSLYNTNSLGGFGSRLRYGSGALSFNHNLYADNYSDNPQLGDNLSLDFVNNVIYNWGIRSGYSGTNDPAADPNGLTNRLNYACNYLIAGPDTAIYSTNAAQTNFAFWGGTTNTWIFQTNNVIDSDTNRILNGANTEWGMFTNQYTRFGRPFPLPQVPTDEAFIAYEKVLDFAGASLCARDWADAGIVTGVRTQTGRIISTPPLSGMVAWWKAENNALDSVGTNDGTLVGGVTYTNGEVGQAFVFAGGQSSNVVDIGDPVDLRFTNSFSIDAWIWVNGLPTAANFNEANIVFRGDTRSFLDPYIFAVMNTGGLRFHIENSAGNIADLDTASIPQHQWVHVAAAFDGVSGLMQVYANGQLIGSMTTAIRPFQNLNPAFYPGVAIGNCESGVSSSPESLNGRIDEVQIYNRALSASEIKSIYDAGSAGTFSTPSCPLYLDTDQDGIPDFWEITFGQPPYVPSNNTASTNAIGYTTLEEYNNWLAVPHALTITNTPVNVNLYKLAGNTGNLTFFVTNAVNGTVYLTNVLGSVTNTGPLSNSIAVFTPTNTSPVFSGHASFDVYVTNTDTIAYFGPVTVSVVVSAVPIAINSNMPPIIITLTNAIPYTNSNSGGSDFYRFTVTPNAAGSNAVAVLFDVLNPSANVTLVARYGLPLPSLSSYDYLSANPGTANEHIVVLPNSTPVALTNGDWYLAVVNISGGPVTYAAKATELFSVVPPVFLYPTNGSSFEVIETTPFTVTCLATDTNTPPLPLTFALVSGPTNMTLNPATGLINWTPTEAQGPFTNLILVSVANAAFSVTNSFTIIVDESNLPPVLPSIPNQVVIVPGTLIVTNTATDPDIPINPLTYTLLSAPTNAVIDTNGVITWTPTLAQAGTNYLFTTVVTDTNPWAVNAKSLSATNSFIVTVLSGLVGGQPQTNTVLANSINWIAVSVPTNAIAATNRLLFATNLPVNVWFSTNLPPTTTNASDVDLMPNATNGVSRLTANSTPTNIVPGNVYFLGVQNTNSLAVTYGLEVDFLLASPTNTPPTTNTIVISSITATNIGGKFGFLLAWYAPTNDYFMVQWTTNLLPLVNWQTFTNIITYTGPVTPTNGRFTFFDDGSQTGGFGPMRFYRLILLQSTNVLTLPFQVNRTIDALTPLVVTNTATDSDTSATLNYTLTSTVPGLPAPGIDANGIITWTPGLAQAGTVNTFTTVVTDNGLPPTSATNSFTVTVSALPVAISSVTLTTNGNFQLQWSAPTNYQFQVAWTTNLVPPVVWSYIPPTPPYITSVTTNFTFVDTNAPTAMKFYRLVEYP